MFTVLIADDEAIIRRGIRKLIDWESLGFSVSGETGDGKNTLDYILEHNPHLVLLDIKMPEMDGIEVLQKARAKGYNGKVIILSGYSDFAYAQEALHLNVSYYLNKPVESALLEQELHDVAKELNREIADTFSANLYRQKALNALLPEILTGSCDFSALNLQDIHLDADRYQVVIWEKYHKDSTGQEYDLPSLLGISNKEKDSLFTTTVAQNKTILLRGWYAVSRFQHFWNQYDKAIKPQDGSPLDFFFLTCGQVVSSAEDICLSYHEAASLMNRRFFCSKGQHTLGMAAAYNTRKSFSLDELSLSHYTSTFTNFLMAGNREGVFAVRDELFERLYASFSNADSIRLFLTDLFLRIREKLARRFPDISLPANREMIDCIRTSAFLYEIRELFTKQAEYVLKESSQGKSTATIDNVIYFIENNYTENLRLDDIAAAFGYNTSYLGTLFSQKTGCSFNSYLEKVRIDKACKLLANPQLRVYDVAKMTGYKNMDYFHLKFKKHTGQTPLEYRRTRYQT